jgi:hypothetical protein
MKKLSNNKIVYISVITVSLIIIGLIIKSVIEAIKQGAKGVKVATEITNDPFGNYTTLPASQLNVPNTPEQLTQIFTEIQTKYGLEVARFTEQIFRLETAHFTSYLYLNTGCANIVPTVNLSPYGWANVWGVNTPEWTNKQPIGIIKGSKRDSLSYWHYLQFRNFGGFMAVAYIVSKITNNIGLYNSLNPVEQLKYKNDLMAYNCEYS